jgi:hypothetical protein
MARFGKIVAAGLALGAVAASASAAVAQTAQRHLQCYALPPIGVSGPFGGGPIQQRAIITNNIGATIPGNTVYTYRIAGHQFTYRAPGALAPGQQLNVAGLVGGTAGACDAWIIVVVQPRTNLNNAPPLGIYQP